MRETLERAAPGCRIVPVDQVTEGAACTVLLARDCIDSDDPLMLANSDQWVDIEIDDYLASMDAADADGLIMTMKAHDPKWSFVGLDAAGWVTRVVEKQVISDEATVGIYNFRRGRDFVCAADQMIAKDLRVNDEFYVAPVYNELIGARSARSPSTTWDGTARACTVSAFPPISIDFFRTRCHTARRPDSTDPIVRSA